MEEDRLLKDMTVGEFKQYMEQLMNDVLSKRMSYPQPYPVPYPVSPIYGPKEPPYKYDVYCQGDINGTNNR